MSCCAGINKAHDCLRVKLKVPGLLRKAGKVEVSGHAPLTAFLEELRSTGELNKQVALANLWPGNKLVDAQR
jgi:hypothetical protein